MKTSFFPSLLVGILLIASVVNAFITVRYFFSVKELEKLQGQVYRNSQVLSSFEGLLNDSIRYSKHNASITPILQALQSEIELRTNATAFPPNAQAPINAGPQTED